MTGTPAIAMLSQMGNPGPVSKIEIYSVAALMLKLGPEDALIQAQELRHEHAAKGDVERSDTWHQISEAIEVLQAKATGMLH